MPALEKKWLINDIIGLKIHKRNPGKEDIC